MKHFLIIFFFLNFTLVKSQDNLQGNWILDKIQYQNGKLLEVNHPLYSTFMEYNFNGNNLEINNQKLKVVIDNSIISTDYRKMKYRIENEYLIITENGDNKVYYFLKQSDFLKKYSEFEPKEVIFNTKSVIESNSVIKPYFKNTENFQDFIRKNIPSYSSASATNNFFKAKFILTKENKIIDIEIEQGISKAFDKEFKIALLKSEKYFKNTFGKDLLITETFNFLKIFSGLSNKEEKQIYDIVQKGNSSYVKNDFNNAIKNYEDLLSINIKAETKERFGYTLDQAYINLGVSYLATGNNQKACESFSHVGDETNFKVRNYLINFCK